MSAFVVSNTTINRIVSYLEASAPRSDRYTERKALEKAYQIIRTSASPNSREFYADLGRAIWRLNIAAVRERYPNDPPMPDSLYHYEYCTAKKIQVVKHLSCLIYQCSEGDVPKHPLYRWLVDLQNALALDIVESLADYDSAEWDAA